MSGILRENMPEVRPFPAVVFPFYPDILLLPEQPLLLPEKRHHENERNKNKINVGRQNADAFFNSMRSK